MAYSTIRHKMGICPLCPPSKGKQALIKGKCNIHYWGERKMISVQRLEAKEIEQDEDLQSVILDLDAIFSRYIRNKDLDKNGMATCVTCGKKDLPSQMHNGHFIPRMHMYTRYSELNCAVQCPDCNIGLRGNIPAYSRYIESIRPGGIELLMEQGHTVYKYSISELKSMIADYSQKLKQLTNNGK